MLDGVKELGADDVLDHAKGLPIALAPFDLVLDTVCSRTWIYRKLLSPKGRMVTICPDPKRPLTSFLYIFASAIYGSRRVRFFSAKPTNKVLAELAAYVMQGTIKPLVSAVHPLSEIGKAHRAMETGGLSDKQIVRLK